MAERILHIGGDAAQHAFVRRLLHEEGLDVESTGDPREGVRRAIARPPDLVLLDIVGHGMEGYETATRLRSIEAFEAVPIITLSDASERDIAISLGCDGVLEKPLDPTRFGKRVRQFLKGKRERVRGTVRRQYLEAYSRSLVAKLEAKVAELTETNERLHQADDVKNRILANLSHELATPLTPLIGYLALLESGRLGPLAPRQRRAVVSCAHSLRRLSSTVDHLLDLADLDDVVAPRHKTSFDLKELAREARRALEAKARSRRIRLDLHLTSRPTIGEGDPARIRQALIHLLDHGIRFSPRGGYVLIEVGTRPDRLLVAVYDSGEVIPANEQPAVFEPFGGPGRRSPDLPPAPILALALARKIAEAQGGSLEVESPPRTHPDTEHDYPGAKFVLELPAAQGRG